MGSHLILITVQVPALTFSYCCSPALTFTLLLFTIPFVVLLLALNKNNKKMVERSGALFVACFPLLMCPPRLSTVDRGLLEPLTRACVRGLPCFLVVCCAPARAAHAFAHICGVGSDRSRVRSRYVCVPCKRCTAGCLGTNSGTVRAHFVPMT